MQYTNGNHLLQNKFNIENVIWWAFFSPGASDVFNFWWSL